MRKKTDKTKDWRLKQIAKLIKNSQTSMAEYQKLAPTYEEISARNPHLGIGSNRSLNFAANHDKFRGLAALAALHPKCVQNLTPNQRRQYPGLDELHRLLVRNQWTQWQRYGYHIDAKRFLTQFGVTEAEWDRYLQATAKEPWQKSFAEDGEYQAHSIWLNHELVILRITQNKAVIFAPNKPKAETPLGKIVTKLRAQGIDTRESHYVITLLPTTRGLTEEEATERLWVWQTLLVWKLQETGGMEQLLKTYQETDNPWLRAACKKIAAKTAPALELWWKARRKDAKTIQIWKEFYRELLEPQKYEMDPVMLQELL